jgi:hypothetical protein
MMFHDKKKLGKLRKFGKSTKNVDWDTIIHFVNRTHVKNTLHLIL